MLIIYSDQGYSFVARSGGIVVLKDDEYIGFFRTLDEAIENIFSEDEDQPS